LLSSIHCGTATTCRVRGRAVAFKPFEKPEVLQRKGDVLVADGAVVGCEPWAEVASSV